MKMTMFKLLSLLLTVPVWVKSSPVFGQETSTVKNIVLVHGAFIDGSGWEDVYKVLTKEGYHVTVTQHTLLTFEGDVAAVNRIIDEQDGPCILVGHSYGGVVISQAGNHPKVAGLVYIAAHVPDANEARAELFKKFPPAYKSLIKGTDGFDYINPENFPEDFAGGVPIEKAKFMAISQIPTADIVFQATIDSPAWKTKPVWYMVAKADRIINPDLERMYAKRANSIKTVEVDGASHSVFMTHPEKVAELIILASKGKE
jgi:pimeloyl-ACP methyl ester carboxylesterase